MSKRIYLDYASTTPLDRQVERAMRPYWSKYFGNAGSVHHEGVVASKALLDARTKIARLIEAHADEIVFTSSGTEANNLAMRGHIMQLQSKGRALSSMHIIVSSIEHSSVRECVKRLEREGVRVSILPVDTEGIVRVNEFEKLLTPETVLVSVMYVNNEIGTIQPIRKLAGIIRAWNQKTNQKVLLHTDACQAPLYLPVGQEYLGADFVSFDGHKICGPKGIGALYVRRGTEIVSLFDGGGQERGRRPSTESVPLAVGLAKAFELAHARREKESKRLRILRDFFFSEIKQRIPSALINGGEETRVPANVNISISQLDAEFAVIQLDAAGIACSTKSSCLRDEGESYVVRALGRTDDSAKSSLRFSLGITTKKSDIKQVLAELESIVHSKK